MYVQGFDGSWLDHPFWRSRFVIQSDRDLEKLRDSGVEAVIIDDEKGHAPAPRAPAPRWEPPHRPVPPPWAPPAYHQRPDQKQSFAGAYSQATKLFGRSKRSVASMYSDVRLGKAIKAEKLAPLVEDITRSIDQNPRAFISVAQLKNRHEYTYMHSVAVCALMINLARELRFNEAAVRDAGMAGLLHDIGKAVMPVEILDKPGALEDHEYNVMKTHPERGHELLSKSSGVSHNALEVCLRHHEKFDGSGYPGGLIGERLSLFARMSALCDVYDAVTSERAYKKPWTPTETVARMREWDGHFDPEMFEIFVRSVGIYPAGALVRLKSGGIAMVTGENPEDPTCPPMIRLPHGDCVETERLPVGSEEITNMESPEALGFTLWEAERARLIRQYRS